MQNIQFAYTSNIDLAAALVALGFSVRKQEPISRTIRPNGTTSDCVYFEPEANTQDFGKLTAIDVIRQWREPKLEFNAKHPAAAQVIDYMRTAFENRRLILAAVKENVRPRIVQSVGNRVLMLPLDASPETLANAKKMVKEFGNE